MSAPTRPDIEGVKRIAAERRAEEKHAAIRLYPSEADLMADAVAWIEYLEQVIRAAIIRLEANGPYLALKKLKETGLPDA